MLLKDFYQILSAEQTAALTWKVSVGLNPLHPVYTGHFPGQPVVPGVCMLQMIVECVSSLLDAPLRYKQIKSCKFLSVVDPAANATLEFLLSVNPEAGIYQLAADGEATGKEPACVIKLKATLA